MRLVRILAVFPLALISLLNVGYIGSEPKPALWLAVAVLALGVAGFVAAFGLARNTTWGIPAALAVAGVNVVGAIIALVSENEGAIIGLAISSLALLLVFLAGARRPKVSPA
jgi:tellurite resistance protein TehA-like permease